MILVVGATGSLGGRIARGLLERGEKVRILTRRNSPSEELAKQGRATSAQSLVDLGAKVVYGDLKDRASLDAAVAGVDTVISTATATQRENGDTLESVDRQGTLNLLDAAQQAGVGHFIYTSATGASPDHPVPLFEIKGSCEQAVTGSGLTYTIVQPSLFMEVWIGMLVGIPLSMEVPIQLIGQGDHAHNFISEADVADFIVGMVDNSRAYNQTVVIGGPASYTWTEIVQETGGRLGMELPTEYLPMGSPIAYLPPEVSVLANGMETFEDFLDTAETARAYGVQPTSLGDFIDRTFVR
ncbi:MAG: SDR family oxidoreductase [Candidatus Promineifilaceae bacterium]|jgi:NADH dehydrogenase